MILLAWVGMFLVNGKEIYGNFKEFDLIGECNTRKIQFYCSYNSFNMNGFNKKLNEVLKTVSASCKKLA